MVLGLSLAILLLSATSSAHTTSQPCLCSAHPSAGLTVNCSSLNLMGLPRLPADTTELHVQDNQLTSVSPGLFDRLVRLEKVSLSENPFHCDCKIQYLRNWLQKNKAIVSKEPTCASPKSVAHTAISELSDAYFASCGLASCTAGAFNAIMGVMLCCLIVLLLWSLRLAKTSTITLRIDERHSGFEANSLHSLKPRHRRRLHTGLSEVSQHSDSLSCREDLEKPLINTDLPPPRRDVLHKKQNIKMHERPVFLRQWNHKNTTSDKQS